MNPNKGAYFDYYTKNAAHAQGTFARKTLSFLYDLLEEMQPACTVETGCGASTIAFALNSRRHLAFCLDDRTAGGKAGSSSKC